MKSFMNVRIPRNTVRTVLEDVDEALEIVRRAYVERRPIEGSEWRMTMNILTAIKVACVEAVRQEECND